MPGRTWISHAGRLLLGITAIGFVGWMTGYPAACLAIAGLLYLGWQIANLWRLHRWLIDPEREVPKSLGLWAGVFSAIQTLANGTRDHAESCQAAIDEFRSLVDAIPDAMLVVDKGGTVTWRNASADLLLGLDGSEILGRPVSSLSRDQVFLDWLDDQAEIQKPLDMPSPQGDGNWLTISSVPLRESERLVILRNVTGIHDVEQIRRDFVANISHELRTPLTVLRGYLELLEDHSSDEISVPVQKMLGPALQMQTLLDDLLELSRLQSGELRGEDRLVNIPVTLEHLREQAEGLSRGDHQIEFAVNPELFLSGVEPDLESAFGNLISNAVKYTPKGGNILVSWDQSPQGPQLRVRDTGIGIPNQDVPRVTERFYRVGSDRARETGGTGLGLAIVKHVLNAHQAQLTITSELGLGSEFVCTFPASRARTGKTGLQS